MQKEVLIKKARDLRVKVLDDIYRTSRGHIGGTYSSLDMFVYLYYGQYGLHHYVDNFAYEDRDRLVIGKGHACLALYNMWEDLGIIKKDLIDDFGNNGSFLSGQLNINTNGVEYSTGSLGHAIGIASGMAMVGRMDKKDYFSIAFIGDGECSEGSIWEAIEFAGKQKLNKLMCIIDFNRLGVTEIINIDGEEETLQTRVLSCGWSCDIIDGHDFDQIEVVMKKRTAQQKPIMVIAKTIKGKGISFMENGIKWHHSVPSEEEYIIARKELEK